jgi:hypothetical protein
LKLAFSLKILSFGGFEYGYQQGVLGQSLVMYKFKQNFPKVVSTSKDVLSIQINSAGALSPGHVALVPQLFNLALAHTGNFSD